VAVFGAGGKVGRVLCPALERAGHEVRELELGDPVALAGVEAMVDFTAPDAVEENVRTSLEQGVACVVGTTGLARERLEALGRLARERGRPLFVAPNFSIGAVLMMRFAAEAAAYLPRAEIIELHNEAKKDAPSGTARATADLIGPGTLIHSVRLPGLVAHQEVLLADEGQLLTIRHDTLSRQAFVPGVLLALERLPTLPAGLTVGLEALLEAPG
jgi:4-hydroxy-tetrahydrodipicolinate reductase